ncbi:MAG: sigma 54-interacting transcriptional regulator [Desulfuromonadaceae bacterium]|nr:sigma 54-interacting transcriptional regulator [Desulfuromonadaceae bacterium]
MDEKRKKLATIADLKTSQLVQWRKERFAEAASIRANAMMAHRINLYIRSNDKAKIRLEFKHWMANLIDLGGYSRGILFTPDGEVIASDPELKTPLSRHYFALVAETAREQELLLTGFHSDNAGDPAEIHLAIPIMLLGNAPSRCIAVLLLDIDPTKRLFPLIQSWPTFSSTAETLLVQREGDSVHFLNQLRHRKKFTVPFLLPLTRHNLPAVRAVLGQEGSFEGRDYRDVNVLSATRCIPGTQWWLVAKVDVSEVMAPLSKSIWVVTLVGVIVVFTMSLGALLWSIRRKAKTLLAQFKIEQQHTLALKKSEDALTRSRDYHSKLLDIFPSLIWKSGTDAHCDYFNQTWLAFTGRTLEQELGDGWIDGVHPDDLKRSIATYMEAFQARHAFKMEYRLRYNDGSYRWINDHGTPYNGVDGSFSGYIGSCYDINLQKEAEHTLTDIHSHLEEEIRERTKDLTEINSLLINEISERKLLEQHLLRAKRLEAIGQIAGGVAHEVRNPLNAILTITEALFREREVASNPEFEPFIHHIRTQINRLVHLMNDLLDLGGTIPAAALQPISLYEVCRETLVLWESSGMSKNKRATLSSDNDDISIHVLTDGLKLQQVFFNLLENAGYFSKEGYEIFEAANLAEAAAALAARRFDIMVLDINLPDGSGIDFIGTARINDPCIPIIVITGEGDIPLAVEAMQHGADNFLTKPVDNAALAVFIRKTLEIGVLKRQQSARKRLEKKDDFFIGENRAMQEMYALALAAAASDIPVLITGETGTGKGMLARWIHQHGSRASNECVELNCSGLRGEMLSREIFGNARGAFTSADQDRKGLLDVADRGTLFLDEIGDMSIDVQAQFLKVLEDKSYRRLGDVKLMRSNFRLICATHHELNSLVSSGRFRQDLMYRINMMAIHLPPLRERMDNLPELVAYLLQSLGSTATVISDDIMKTLRGYHWPGNIRELKNVLERALLLTPHEAMLRQIHFSSLTQSRTHQTAPNRRTVQEVEGEHIRTVLDQAEGNIEKAAKTLNISRATLYRRLKQNNE